MIVEKFEVTKEELKFIYNQLFTIELWTWAEKDSNGTPNYKLSKSCVGYVSNDMLTKKYYAYPYRTYFKPEYRYNSGLGPFDGFKEAQVYLEGFNNKLQQFLRRVFNIEVI